MAITKTEYGIEWAAASSKTVADTASETSDSRAIADNAVGGVLLVKVDHQGTPASGDEVILRVLLATDTSDDATPEHAIPHVVDLYAEDPGVIAIPVNVQAKSFKLHTYNDAGANVVVSAKYQEQQLNEPRVASLIRERILSPRIRLPAQA